MLGCIVKSKSLKSQTSQSRKDEAMIQSYRLSKLCQYCGTWVYRGNDPMMMSCHQSLCRR